MRADSQPMPPSWARALLVRRFVEVLSRDAAVAHVWAQGCVVLAALGEARCVSVALRLDGEDRIVHSFSRDTAHDASVRSVAAESLAGRVLQSNETRVTGNSAAGDLAIGVPIRFGQRLLGVLCFEGAAADDANLMTSLESCALCAGARLNAEEMLRTNARYEELAFTDALTGIANRRRFEDVLQAEWRRAARTTTSIALLLLDVDYFKVFNDTYGHPAGDDCLRQVASAIAAGLGRSADLSARYGGEEFVVLLPDTDEYGAVRLAEALKARVHALQIEHAGSSLGFVSISVGAAACVPTFSNVPTALTQEADRALYSAKKFGRNRVFAAGYAQPLPPEAALRIVSVQANNVPLVLTRLIGRSAEIRDVRTLLGEHRLVTITSCGGAGKTRLSLALADDLLGAFTDGVWFVDLARWNDPRLLAATIGNRLGFESPGGDAAVADLVRAIGDRDVLLVLDNCEHLLEAVAQLTSALLRGCRNMRVLATSREPLGIAGEQLYRLPLLAVPPASGALGASEAQRYDAVTLFVERARAVQRDFALTDDNAAIVASICRRLDGIPLALELAAARVSVLGLRELAQRLTTRFRLLTGGDKTASPHHKTLRASIDWSYDLLSCTEQIVFRRLAVFAGGWTLEAMIEVCSGDAIAADDVVDALTGLIAKSLVVDGKGGTERRYELLESVRAYAREKLDATGEAARLSRRHAGSYLRLAQRSRDTYRTTASKAWFTCMRAELENFRAALQWLLGPDGDHRLGALLAGALVVFLVQISPNESLRWVRKALELLPSDAEPALEAALHYGISLATDVLPPAQTRAAVERAVDLNRQSGDHEALGEALRNAALILSWYFPAERAAAAALADEALDLALAHADPIRISLALIARSVTIDDANVTAKRAALEESLALSLAHGNDLQTANAYLWIAEYEFAHGDPALSLTYARDGLRHAERSGSAPLTVRMTTNLAQYTAAVGDGDEALRATRSALEAAASVRMDEQVTWSIQACAVVHADAGDFTRAAQLLGFCDRRAGALHARRQAGATEERLSGRIAARLEAYLRPADLAAARAAGEKLSEIEAIELGLGGARERTRSA